MTISSLEETLFNVDSRLPQFPKKKKTKPTIPSYGPKRGGGKQLAFQIELFTEEIQFGVLLNQFGVLLGAMAGDNPSLTRTIILHWRTQPENCNLKKAFFC